MDSYLDILNSFFNGENKYYVPEILIAFRKAGVPIKNQLIIKLKNTLEKMSMTEWPRYAPSLVHIFRNAETEELKIACYESILSYDTESEINDADRRMGWSSDAKRSAIQYLSELDNNKALDVISKALKFYDINSDAVEVLQNTDYGITHLIEYIRTEEKPSRAAVRALLGNETDYLIDIFLNKLNHENSDIVNILVEHRNETVRNKALEIIEKRKLIRSNEINEEKQKRCVNIDELDIINYQTNIKGRKKHKYIHRDISQNTDGTAYFKCPFCNNTNTINNDHCIHVVYAYETVNNLVISKNEAFINNIIKLISADPSKYIEDFDYLLEEYLDDQNYDENQKVVIDIDDLKEILENNISPDVLDMIFNINGIPEPMKSLIVYSLVDDYIGGGTYYYIVSDTDLEKINRSITNS